MRVFLQPYLLIILGLLLVVESSPGLLILNSKYDAVSVFKLVRRGDSSDSKTGTDPNRSRTDRPSHASAAKGKSKSIDTPTHASVSIHVPDRANAPAGGLASTRQLDEREHRRRISRESARRCRARWREQLRAEDPDAIRRQEAKREKDRNWNIRRTRGKEVIRDPYKLRSTSPRTPSSRREEDERRKGKIELTPKREEATPSGRSLPRKYSDISMASEGSRDGNRQKDFIVISQQTPEARPRTQTSLDGITHQGPMMSTPPLPPSMLTTPMLQHVPGVQPTQSNQVQNVQTLPAINSGSTRNDVRRSSSASIWSAVLRSTREESEVTSLPTGMYQNSGIHNAWPQAAFAHPGQYTNVIPWSNQQLSQKSTPTSSPVRMAQIFQDFQREP